MSFKAFAYIVVMAIITNTILYFCLNLLGIHPSKTTALICGCILGVAIGRRATKLY